MKHIEFPEQNFVYHKPDNMTDEECTSLPVYKDGTQVISCWEMDADDKINLLFFNRVWLGVLTNGNPPPPVWLASSRTVFEGEQKIESGFFMKHLKRKVEQYFDLAGARVISEAELKIMQFVLIDFVSFLIFGKILSKKETGEDEDAKEYVKE